MISNQQKQDIGGNLLVEEKRGSQVLGSQVGKFSVLTDLLCIVWSVCQAVTKAGNSNTGTFLFTL